MKSFSCHRVFETCKPPAMKLCVRSTSMSNTSSRPAGVVLTTRSIPISQVLDSSEEPFDGCSVSDDEVAVVAEQPANSTAGSRASVVACFVLVVNEQDKAPSGVLFVRESAADGAPSCLCFEQGGELGWCDAIPVLSVTLPLLLFRGPEPGRPPRLAVMRSAKSSGADLAVAVVNLAGDSLPLAPAVDEAVAFASFPSASQS